LDAVGMLCLEKKLDKLHSNPEITKSKLYNG